MSFHKSLSRKGNGCFRDVRYLEIRFTSPSTVPQLNSISIVSKKESVPLYEKFLFIRSLSCPFCFLRRPNKAGAVLKISSHWRDARDYFTRSPLSWQRDLNRLHFYDSPYYLAKAQTKWKSSFNFLLITFQLIFRRSDRQLCLSYLSILSNFLIDLNLPICDALIFISIFN